MSVAAALPSAAPQRSWSDVIDLGIRITILLLIVFNTVGTVPVADHFLHEYSRDIVAGLMALSLATVVMIVVVATDHWREAGSWLMLALSLAGLILATPETLRGPELAQSWWPTQFLFSATVFLTLTVPRRGWLLAAVLLAANAVMRGLFWSPTPALPDYTRALEVTVSTGQLVALTAAAWIGGTFCRRAAREVDAAHAMAEAGRAQAREQEQAALRTKEVDRFVHDEILHGLRAVAMAGDGVDPAELRVLARRLAARLAPSATQVASPPADPSGVVGQLAHEAGRAGLSVSVSGPMVLPLPKAVEQALLAAGRETVRNIVRHAAATRAMIEVTIRGLILVIEIKDNGVGFEPRTTERRGLASSVTARMRDIGGSAEIDSAPGEGTVVRLTWSPVREVTPGVIGGGSIDELFPYLSLTAAPILAMGLWFPLFLAGMTRWPLVLSLASAAIVTIGAAAMIYGLHHRLQRWHSAGMIGVSWAATAIAGLALPSGLPNPRLMWMAGACSAMISVLSIYRPIVASVICSLGLVTITAITTVLVTPPGQPWSVYIPAVIAPLVTLAIAIALRRVADRMAWDVLRSERESRAGSDDAAAEFERQLHSRIAARRHQLDSLVAEAATAVSHDQLDRIRDQALALETALREELMVGDHASLRSVVTVLRSSGWQLRLRLAPGLPALVAEAAANALVQLGAALPGEADVTALPAGRLWRLSLLVVPDLPDGRVRALAEDGWSARNLGTGVRLVRTVNLAP